jgi:hypothetical protein
MSVTLTITADTVTPEFLKGIEGLLSGMSSGVSVNGSKKTSAAPVIPMATNAKSDPEQTTSVVKTSDVTIEQLREAVQVKSTAGKRDEIKGILSELGVKNVTSLEKDKYAEFLSKVQGL